MFLAGHGLFISCCKNGRFRCVILRAFKGLTGSQSLTGSHITWISHLGGLEKFSESVTWPDLFINLARFTGLKKSKNFSLP